MNHADDRTAEAAAPAGGLVPSRSLLDAARREGRAVAALNFYNAETLLAHVRAANECRASVILQTTESTISYLGLRLIVAMARAAAEEMEMPSALHLDHGASYDLAARCVDAGYTSVMIDGSRLPFAENCALTRRVVEVAHAAGVSVEGELGLSSHFEVAASVENAVDLESAVALHASAEHGPLTGRLGVGWQWDAVESGLRATVALSADIGACVLYASSELEAGELHGALAASVAVGDLTPVVEVGVEREVVVVATGMMWQLADDLVVGGAAALDSERQPSVFVRMTVEMGAEP